MSETAINEYLTKQVKVNGNIITFRLLSRALSLHVNKAKSALAAYYESNKSLANQTPLHATYIITGEALEPSNNDSMDVDIDQLNDAPSAISESVPRRKIMVVPEEKLEEAKTSFKTVQTIHHYSLAPSTFQDPSLLVTTVDAVRNADSSRTVEDLRKLGIPISNACKPFQGKPKGSAQSTAKSASSKVPAAAKDAKPKPAATTAVTVEKKPAEKEDKKPAPTTTTTQSSVSKTEASRKSSKTAALDWSKAKPKAVESDRFVKVKAEPQETKINPEPPKKAERGPNTSTSKQVQPKRGIKRPSPPTEDEEGDEARQPPKSRPRISEPVKSQSIAVAKRGVIHSDDDEESDVPSRIVRRKTKSEAAIMEWSDDENVVQAPRHTPGPPSSRDDGDDDNEDEDDGDENSPPPAEQMELSDAEEPKYAKASRTKKKAWPVGANGLRKRRIVKSRQYTDDKGFMAIEDYSEYESVNSESEQPPDPSNKAKRSAKPSGTQSASKITVETKPAPSAFQKSSSKPKPKQSGAASVGGKKKTLDSFFQKR